MSIKIGSNLASLNAQRRLSDATISLSSIYEKLSSGQRINRASDDAAGLAIADDLKAKSRVYSQAIRNGNDGLSLLNITDSAVDALSGIVIRIRELSEQSANGTYSDEQRQALDNEAQALSAEFTRISQTTTFNGIKLLDGSLLNGIRLQLGAGIEETIEISSSAFQISTRSLIGTGNFNQSGSTTGTATYAVALGDINGDGINDLVSAENSQLSIYLGTAQGDFEHFQDLAGVSNQRSVVLRDLNGDEILDLVSAGTGGSNVSLGLGNGSFGTFTFYSTDEANGSSNSVSVADLNNDGFLDIATAGRYNDGSLKYGQASILLGNGDGSFQNPVSYQTQFDFWHTDSNSSNDLTVGDVNGDGVSDIITTGSTFIYDFVYYNHQYKASSAVLIGNGDGSFTSGDTYYEDEFTSNDAIASADLNNDGILDLVTAGSVISVRFGNGNGTFGSSTIYSTQAQDIVLRDLNYDGFIDLMSAGSNISVRYGSANGSFGEQVIVSSQNNNFRSLAFADLDGDDVLDFVAAANLNSIFLAESEAGGIPRLSFSLITESDSLESMEMLDQALQSLARQKGQIGAAQSRINIALNNLQTTTENFKAAESRIRDVDIASEAANLSRIQILQQAATSVLSQANQSPQLALTLLR